MTRELIGLSAAVLLAATFTDCGDSGSEGTSTGTGGASPGTGGAGGALVDGGPSDSEGAGGGAGAGGSSEAGSATCDEMKGWVDAYKAAHPGNGGKDWDISAKSPAQIAADPAAQQLLSICGKDQRPIIPLLAWEYGGADHAWISPEASALAYCVYIPVQPSSTNWQYDAAADHVTADVYVRCPDQNPCKNEQGANQVMACLGDPTNIEIVVDTASLNDGGDVGLSLANASTDLNLILPNGTKVHLFTGQ
jgi:hypothetical protein